MAELAAQDNLPNKWQPLAVHPVDLPLDVLQGAMEYAVGQPVELGIPYGANHHYDEDVTGAVRGSGCILAYGTESADDIWEFPFWNKQLEKLDPTWVYAGGYLKARDEYTSVDQRHISRMMVADAEVKPLEDFTRDAILRVVNVPAADIAASGINLANVSHSQASRIIDVMRNQYADGNWRQTLQLALAVPHIGSFIRIARETSYRDETDAIVTIADDHIGQELQAEYRTDVDLLVARALKRGVQELRANGRKHAANHAEAWLAMHEEGLSLDSFPPEVTIEDILTRPSYLNPRPDKGVPVLSAAAYLAGGTGSRNYTIKYPDGSIYAVDFPTHSYGARPIRGEEDKGYRGNLTDDTVNGFVHTNAEWLDFGPTAARHVADELVDEAMRKGVSFKQENATYSDMLRTASAFVDERNLGLDKKQISVIKNQLAVVLMAAQCVERTETTVGSATSLFEFSLRGWGIKGDVEEETGIRLTFGDGLDETTKDAYNEFGSALYGYELARLAEAYAEHPELSAHIAQNRSRRQLTENAGRYYGQMMEAARRLMGKGKTAELVSRFFEAGQGPKRFPAIEAEQ